LALPALVILLGVALLVGGRTTSAWASGAIDADGDGD
jgi:hypothetical protein